MPVIVESLPEVESSFERSSVKSAQMVAHFGDLTGPAIEFIARSSVILGCVAWLTSYPILDALAKVDDVALVVQKEDFLRPDLGATKAQKTGLRKRYDRLSCDIPRYSMPMPLSEMSYLSDPEVRAVRCAGHGNAPKSQAMPRMHHKFLVRCVNQQTDGGSSPTDLRAEAVWTGSFNFSNNGAQSFENAVEIHDEVIAAAYLHEFARVASISEPLDWTSEWAEPTWRIGS
jgi:hypothetical protein